MAEIRLTVKAEIIDARGERFVVERMTITPTQDNSRFWLRTVDTDLDAVVGTVKDMVGEMYGGKDALERS